jgi:hemoglobin
MEAMSEQADLKDIEDRTDCECLVRAFYGRAMSDAMIGYLFVEVAKLDLEAHVPAITSFWETVLLGAKTYNSSAFRPHAELHSRTRLRPGHFERWLVLWFETVDELFEGERANMAKIHALRVAQAFQGRLQSIETVSSTEPGGDLTVTLHGRPPGPSGA